MRMNQTQIRSEILLIHIYSDNSLGVEEPRIQFLWQPWKACWISLYKSQQSNVFSWYLLKKWEKVFHLINRVYGLTPRSNEYSRGKDVTNGFHLFPHRHYHLNCIECFFFFFDKNRDSLVRHNNFQNKSWKSHCRSWLGRLVESIQQQMSSEMWLPKNGTWARKRNIKWLVL